MARPAGSWHGALAPGVTDQVLAPNQRFRRARSASWADKYSARRSMPAPRFAYACRSGLPETLLRDEHSVRAGLWRL